MMRPKEKISEVWKHGRWRNNELTQRKKCPGGGESPGTGYRKRMLHTVLTV
jgi:hypothetical protein